jgi:serine/threonine-protein kinase/endoribonuclease IRE1
MESKVKDLRSQGDIWHVVETKCDQGVGRLENGLVFCTSSYSHVLFSWMAPHTRIAALLALAVASCAEIISLRASTKHPSITDLQTHQQNYRFLPPIPSNSDSTESVDLKLLDIVLLASVDGQFHALDRKSGQKLWSMSPPPPADSVSSSLGPLVRTQHVKHDPDLVDGDEELHQELYIIEPQSGNIFVMPTPNSPLQRLPYPMARLVEMSPLSIADEHAKRIFVGKKETTLLVVELETGRVKARINSECPWDPFEELAENNELEDLDLDELDGTKPPRNVATSTEVFIGRTGRCPTPHSNPPMNSSSRLSHLDIHSTKGPFCTSSARSTPVIFHVWAKQRGH